MCPGEHGQLLINDLIFIHYYLFLIFFCGGGADFFNLSYTVGTSEMTGSSLNTIYAFKSWDYISGVCSLALSRFFFNYYYDCDSLAGRSSQL